MFPVYVNVLFPSQLIVCDDGVLSATVILQ